MGRIVSFVSILIVSTAALVSSSLPVSAYSPDDGFSTEFRENLLPARKGDAKAQVFVAYLYETGQGVKQDYAKAAEWYARAARQGNAVAQTQLGNMYRLGRGVTQNYVLAYMWLGLAERQGSPQARDLKKTIVKKMSGAQITEAKRLLKNWKAGK